MANDSATAQSIVGKRFTLLVRFMVRSCLARGCLGR
jgi:hypothetical protein